MDGHPTALDLELLRTGEADDDVRAHLETCAACRERLAAARDLAGRIARPLEALPVPRALDEALERSARERGAAVRRVLEERRGRTTLRRIVPWAVAACLLLALGAVLARYRPTTTTTTTAATAGRSPASTTGGDDVNGDGRVDVIDAYLVALAAERRPTAPRIDRGRFGARDAERIARAAVALGGRGGRGGGR